MEFIYEKIKINYEIIGSGIPILIIHGLGCDMRLMKGCIEPIFNNDINNKKYKRIYIDLPGMGYSEGNIEYASSDKIVEILNDFVKKIINEKFILIGESYGGYLSRGLLLNYINEILGLMLLCPVINPIQKERILPKKNIKEKEEKFLKTLSLEEKKKFLDFSVIATKKVYNRHKKEIEVGIKLANIKFIRELRKNYKFSLNVDEIIGENFYKPTLFIVGKEDNIVGYVEAEKLSKNYKNCKYELVENAGHNLQIEQEEIFNKLTINWIKEIENKL